MRRIQDLVLEICQAGPVLPPRLGMERLAEGKSVRHGIPWRASRPIVTARVPDGHLDRVDRHVCLRPVGVRYPASTTVRRAVDGRRMVATYTLTVERCFARQVRSGGFDNTGVDTLVASAGLRVMDAEGALHQDYQPIAINMGDHPNGDIPEIGLAFANVDVPDPTADNADGGAVYWTFLLVNHGGADAAAINVVSDTAKNIAGAMLGSGVLNVQIAGGIILAGAELMALLAPGCDGLIASQSWAFTAKELAASTPWGQTTDYPGVGAGVACGATSNYDVTYSISQPTQVGKGAKDAKDLREKRLPKEKNEAKEAKDGWTGATQQTGTSTTRPEAEGF
jgi:hypothetical protein